MLIAPVCSLRATAPVARIRWNQLSIAAPPSLVVGG
jgi:hypothetical protein